MENTHKQEKYLRAQDRVAEIKRFYTKAINGLIAIGILAGINYYHNEWLNPWFLWVAFWIAFATILKAIKIFGVGSFFGKGWEERKIRDFIQEEEKTSKWH